MDLDLNLPGFPGPPDGGGCGPSRQPAFNFSEQPSGMVQAVAESMPPVARVTLNDTLGWYGSYGRAERSVLEETACAREMAAEERDQFLEGCLKIQEDERLRLGRELHDSTGQLLLALRLNVAQLRRVHGLPAEDQLLDEIEETASRIDLEIRSFAFLHYPAEIEREGLGESLHFLTRGFAARTGLKINFISMCDRAVQSSPAALALLRVAQEALMNVHRHACALHVRVSLTMRDRLLQLSIRDDGVGIPPASDVAKSHGVGLLGMRHRVERLGGHFAIKRLKHGTKLTASVPIG